VRLCCTRFKTPSLAASDVGSSVLILRQASIGSSSAFRGCCGLTPIYWGERQAAPLQFFTQPLFLLLRRISEQPMRAPQANICQDLFPEVLIEPEKALVR
jgi:hypothetical protein